MPVRNVQKIGQKSLRSTQLYGQSGVNQIYYENDPKEFLGLVLNMVGGMMYSWVKYHEGERKKRDKLSGDTSNPGNSDAANNEVSSALSPLNE